MKQFCCAKQRLEVIKGSGGANGIEFIEVRDRLEPDPALRQRTLFVRLLRPVPVKPGGDSALEAQHVLIDGGERRPVIPVEWAAAANRLPAAAHPALAAGIGADELKARTLVVRTALPGDFSQYTLHLRKRPDGSEPPDGFDPRLSEVGFSFKVECAADVDCDSQVPCPPEVPDRPDIDYLARDYTGFRRLMLDRLQLLAPGWRERSAADVGVALVEMLAYAADNLSYRQDAIANEAYLATARRRVSVRRHARLVDYALHDGCNARTWVHLEVTSGFVLPKGTPLLTGSAALPVVMARESQDARSALAAGAVVFEAAHRATLFPDLNRLSFYTWGDRGCCLPRGACSATLRGAQPLLKAGAILVFQELVSPTTFEEQDADRSRRWAVRLTSVRPDVDPSGGLFDPQPQDAALPITEIAWDPADALPFPLCISVAERPGVEVSVALGNIVLADHGQTIVDEKLGPVPAAVLREAAAATASGMCQPAQPAPVPARFRPALAGAPVTQGYPLEQELALALADQRWPPASALIARDPRDALPQMIALEGSLDGVLGQWTAQRDLLSSEDDTPDYVVETENDGGARLRFGDGANGRRPPEGTVFAAAYRVGNGSAGNVGAGALAHILTGAAGVVTGVTNPLPAAGGVDPEDIEAARRDAPEAFRTQERAVTAADYAAAAGRLPQVQRAEATFRWTGSWRTVFLTVDRAGGGEVDRGFKDKLRAHLERFRMAGYDLELDAPRFVALDLALHVCVQAAYLRSQVVRALRLELGSGILPDGRLALFHPDNFTFGQPVYLSRIVATAQAVEGVEAVRVGKFERFGQPDGVPLETGVLPMGRLQIAQLADNPNFPERGRLVIEAGGGR